MDNQNRWILKKSYIRPTLVLWPFRDPLKGIKKIEFKQDINL
jgi:hypothetical protein